MSAQIAPFPNHPAGLPPRDGGRAALAGAPADTAPHDIGELCKRFAPVCESAVDSLEICSALEFEGLNDQAVRQRYGLPDVFALAEVMYRRVPRRPAEPEPLPDPWPSGVIRPALHGLLYGLPAVFYPAAAGLLAGRGVLTVLIVALVTSWAISQGLAYIGYVRLGRAGRAGASRLLRFGMAAGIAGAGAALLLATLAAHARVPVLIFGTGFAAYMLGATVLLVLGTEQLMLIALAPGVLGATAFLLLGRPLPLEHAAWGMLAITPLLAVGLAAAYTTRQAGVPRLFRGARRRPETPAAAGQLLVRAELLGALPSAGFGLLAAGLIVFPVAAGAAGHGGAGTGALLASLPLALSMGAAEWTLVWFRRRTQRLLRATRESRAFATRARLTLLAALLQYLGAAVLLTAAIVAIAAGSHLIDPDWADVPQIAAYLALGGAMFVALLLQAFGSRTFPLIVCAVTLAFEVGYRGLGVSVQVVACGELLVVLTGYSAVVLGSVVRHAT